MGQLSSGPGTRLFVADNSGAGLLPVALAKALSTLFWARTFGAGGAFVKILSSSLESSAL